MTTVQSLTHQHRVVSPDEWISAGANLLAKEKEFTRFRDEVSRHRRELPWVRVDNYIFEGPNGKQSLSDLFEGKSQLIVYHFMFAPGWKQGCPACSFVCDHTDAARQHFEHHDAAFAAISRAPLDEILPFKKRMGWTFPWFSSFGSEFNYDFGVSYRRENLDSDLVLHNFSMQKLGFEEQTGLSVFTRGEDGEIYRTYSSYERGVDMLIGAYNFLDLTPKGRNETHSMDWIEYHDLYTI